MQRHVKANFQAGPRGSIGQASTSLQVFAFSLCVAGWPTELRPLGAVMGTFHPLYQLGGPASPNDPDTEAKLIFPFPPKGASLPQAQVRMRSLFACVYLPVDLFEVGGSGTVAILTGGIMILLRPDTRSQTLGGVEGVRRDWIWETGNVSLGFSLFRAFPWLPRRGWRR